MVGGWDVCVVRIFIEEFFLKIKMDREKLIELVLERNYLWDQRDQNFSQESFL